MKKVKLWKILLLGLFLYILYLIGITVWHYSTYTYKSYLKDEFHVKSNSSNSLGISDFVMNDDLKIKNRNDAFLYSLEFYKRDSSLVRTNTIYRSISKKDIFSDSLEYGLAIYSFGIKRDFSLKMIKNKMQNKDWYMIHSLGDSELFSYEINKKMGLKGNLEINSLEYYYEGDIIKELDSLNGRIKTILLKPKIFEIGFNNNQIRKLQVKPAEAKQPLSVSFYQKENKLFVIFLSSEKNKITENLINEFIVFE